MTDQDGDDDYGETHLHIDGASNVCPLIHCCAHIEVD